MGYGEAKKQLLEKINAYFAPARERRRQLGQDPAFVDDVLRKGAEQARSEAQQTMTLVREAVGLRAATTSRPKPHGRAVDTRPIPPGNAATLPD
jgi:tryptophanyl-tRNA synthetase